jgi:hypothetical protein
MEGNIMIEKNTWVRIHKIVLKPEERSNNLPEETKKVPLELWVKGYLQNDANIGDEVIVKTRVHRLETGTLVEINPSYLHNYGEFVKEILEIDEIIKKAIDGDNYE